MAEQLRKQLVSLTTAAILNIDYTTVNESQTGQSRQHGSVGSMRINTDRGCKGRTIADNVCHDTMNPINRYHTMDNIIRLAIKPATIFDAPIIRFGTRLEYERCYWQTLFTKQVTVALPYILLYGFLSRIVCRPLMRVARLYHLPFSLLYKLHYERKIICPSLTDSTSF